MREASSVFTSPYRYRDWTKGGVEFLPSDAKGEGGCGVQRPDPEGHAWFAQ